MEKEHACREARKPSKARSVAGPEQLWIELLTYARVNVGLSKDEFLDLTPRYFDALVNEHRRCIERSERGRDYMLAQIVAGQYNLGHLRFEEWRQPREFMPAYPSEVAAKQRLRRNERAFTSQLERTMERAVRYQNAQVSRG